MFANILSIGVILLDADVLQRERAGGRPGDYLWHDDDLLERERPSHRPRRAPRRRDDLLQRQGADRQDDAARALASSRSVIYPRLRPSEAREDDDG